MLPMTRLTPERVREESLVHQASRTLRTCSEKQLIEIACSLKTYTYLIQKFRLQLLEKCSTYFNKSHIVQFVSTEILELSRQEFFTNILKTGWHRD